MGLDWLGPLLVWSDYGQVLRTRPGLCTLAGSVWYLQLQSLMAKTINMRAFPVSLESTSSSYPFFFYPPPTATIFSSRFINPNFHNTQQSITPSTNSIHSLHRTYNPYCSTTDSSLLDTNDNDEDVDDCFDSDDYGGIFLSDEKTESSVGDSVYIEVKKIGRNSRGICSRIEINANLETVWNILTDYEKLADFIPGLAVSKLLEKKGNCARIYQIGQQNLPLGIKFSAKAVLECYEKDLEILPSGKRREIEFKMIEGDFQSFVGKWSIEQITQGIHEGAEDSSGEEFQTTLSYIVEVKPKMYLPVGLVEGRMCSEIKTNMSCIREEARKIVQQTLCSS